MNLPRQNLSSGKQADMCVHVVNSIQTNMVFVIVYRRWMMKHRNKGEGDWTGSKNINSAGKKIVRWESAQTVPGCR